MRALALEPRAEAVPRTRSSWVVTDLEYERIEKESDLRPQAVTWIPVSSTMTAFEYKSNYIECWVRLENPQKIQRLRTGTRTKINYDLFWLQTFPIWVLRLSENLPKIKLLWSSAVLEYKWSALRPRTDPGIVLSSTMTEFEYKIILIECLGCPKLSTVQKSDWSWM